MKVAQALGWRYLDSGVLYRLVGLLAVRAGADPVDEPTLVKISRGLSPRFSENRVFLPCVGQLENSSDPTRSVLDHVEAGGDGFEDVTEAIRSEAVGNMASRIAVLPQLRAQLLSMQRGFRLPPGLVADGRDMGTVVFTDASVKVFLTASAGSRAERRHKQLIDKGISANLADLLTDLEARDARDSQRATAPLKPAVGAFVLDSTALSIDQTVTAVLERYAATLLANAGSNGGVDAV